MNIECLPEIVRHGELLVFGVHDGDLGTVSIQVESVLLHLARKLLLVGHGEEDLLAVLLQLLGDLHDAVAPVVGSLHVAHIVDVVVSDDQRLFELVSIGLCAVSSKTMTEKED